MVHCNGGEIMNRTNVERRTVPQELKADKFEYEVPADACDPKLESLRHCQKQLEATRDGSQSLQDFWRSLYDM